MKPQGERNGYHTFSFRFCGYLLHDLHPERIPCHENLLYACQTLCIANGSKPVLDDFLVIVTFVQGIPEIVEGDFRSSTFAPSDTPVIESEGYEASPCKVFAYPFDDVIIHI